MHFSVQAVQPAPETRPQAPPEPQSSHLAERWPAEDSGATENAADGVDSTAC